MNLILAGKILGALGVVSATTVITVISSQSATTTDPKQDQDDYIYVYALGNSESGEAVEKIDSNITENFQCKLTNTPTTGQSIAKTESSTFGCEIFNLTDNDLKQHIFGNISTTKITSFKDVSEDGDGSTLKVFQIKFKADNHRDKLSKTYNKIQIAPKKSANPKYKTLDLLFANNKTDKNTFLFIGKASTSVSDIKPNSSPQSWLHN